jgi:hypothetical protein
LAALRKRKDRKKRNAEREEAAAPAPAADPAQNDAAEAADGAEVEPYVADDRCKCACCQHWFVNRIFWCNRRAMTKKELQKELKRQEREELRRVRSCREGDSV